MILVLRYCIHSRVFTFPKVIPLSCSVKDIFSKLLGFSQKNVFTVIHSALNKIVSLFFLVHWYMNFLFIIYVLLEPLSLKLWDIFPVLLKYVNVSTILKLSKITQHKSTIWMVVTWHESPLKRHIWADPNSFFTFFKISLQNQPASFSSFLNLQNYNWTKAGIVARMNEFTCKNHLFFRINGFPFYTQYFIKYMYILHNQN